MRLRKLALAIGASAVLASNLGFALGLGEITLNSALNQPLDAQIKLLQVRDLSEEEVVVKLASREAYELANVERIFFLTGLKFEVVLDDPANPHIRVTSKDNVREPYLNFLLETQWPTGRMLREYTVLMDLPTFSEKNKKAVVAPEQESAPAQVKSRPSVRPGETTTVQKPASKPAVPRAQAQGEAGAYTVRANDTMWAIALQSRPDRSFSVQQTMLAIQRLNPDAFINDNINLLKKGQVLRLPNADEITSLSTRQAINEVAYQNSQWSGGAALEASRRSGAVAEGQTAREGQVKLRSDSAANDVSSGSGTRRNTEVLQNELAIAQEQLDSSRRQNSELQSQVSALEEQISTMERLLDVTSEELRALQLSAGQTVEAASPEVEATAEPEVEPKPQPAKPAAATVVRNDAVEPSLLDIAIDNILYIGLGLLAVLGGLFFWSRRKDAAESDEDLDVFAEDDEDGAGDQFDFGADTAFDDEPEVEDVPADEFEEIESAEAETADVAGEADIYIAYGKYDQAEDMLLKALAREPGRVDVSLKLLEVYSETQNLDEFDRHYADLLANADSSTRQRAEELREAISGAGEFDRTRVMPSQGSLDSGFDQVDPLLSLEAEGLEDDEFDALEGLGSLDGDFGDLNSDLNSELNTEVESTAKVSATDLDFSLDDLDDTSDDESFLLDLDDEKDASTEEFSLDLDLDAPTESKSTRALAASDDAESDDFSLDLDEFELSLDDESEAPAAQKDDTFELSLDDELESFSTDDDAFELSLDDASPSTPVKAADAGFELSLDDELESFSVGSAEEEDDLGASSASSDAPSSIVHTDFDLELDDELSLDGDKGESADELESLSVEADDFDTEDNFGGMDLAALDQEMDSLSVDMEVEDSVPSPQVKAPKAEEPEEFDLSADLGIEDGADELPPLSQDNDDVFEQALAGSHDAGDEDDMDAELGFLADSDEVATKLDLARAYIDMGDSEGARDILGEVIEEGDNQQKGEARELLSRIG